MKKFRSAKAFTAETQRGAEERREIREIREIRVLSLTPRFSSAFLRVLCASAVKSLKSPSK
jgi:hypothetical protein